MKKIILTFAAVFAISFTNAQSNEKGTIHVNVMGGFLGGSDSEQADKAGSAKKDYSAAGAQFAGVFHYGLSESISAGIGLEFGTTLLTPDNSDNSYISDNVNPSVSTFKAILSGRYYLLNKDKVNIFVGPSVGYTSGTSSIAGIDFSSTSKSYSGLNYGINAGSNFYFSNHVGMLLNLGYEGNSLAYTETESGFPDELGKASLSGVKFMVGLALKF